MGILSDLWFFFQKIKISFEIVIIVFLVLKLSPWVQNQVLLGVKIECCPGSKLSASTQSQCLCGCTPILNPGALYFDIRQHSILTPSSTWFWRPELIFQTKKKAINPNFKRNLDFFFEIAINLRIFLRFYGKNNFFKTW